MKGHKNKPTRSQHYVWQHYLKAWDTKDGVHCLRKAEGRLFCTGTQSVAQETFFYKSERLSNHDLLYLNLIIEKANSEELRQVHRTTVELFQLSFKLQDQLEQISLHPDDQRQLHQQYEDVSKTIGESMHTVVERDMLRFIEDLRRGRCGFYTNIDKGLVFIHFIAHQFFRTPMLKQLAGRLESTIEGLDLKRTWLIESNIYAVNLGFFIFNQREAYKFTFIDNDTSTPFITGDQPVINLNTEKDNEISLYYPLSPALALIFEKSEEFSLRRRKKASDTDVSTYNQKIAEKSYDQLYSNSGSCLQAIAESVRENEAS